MGEQEDFIAQVNADARAIAIRLINELGTIQGENRAERAIALVGGALKATRNGTLLQAAAALDATRKLVPTMTAEDCVHAIRDQVVE